MIGEDDEQRPITFAAGDSPMARLVQEFDWSATPLGPSVDWPPELKTVARQILESRFPAAVIWGSDYVTIYNDAFLPILGDKPEALGRSFADIWSEIWSDIGPIAERACKGEATYIEDFPLLINRSGRSEQAYFTFCYSPLRLADGSVAGFLDTVVETTAAVRVRADLALMNDELSHRLKNSLSLVQLIARQTLRDVTEQDAVAALMGRIVALGQAHDILLNQNWSEASLLQVIQRTLRPLDGLNQISISGADLPIGSRATMAMSLILHELATNAAKYGALSVPEGRIAVSWKLDGDVFRFRWIEMDGPAVSEPARKGFGSMLMDTGLGRGTVARRYPASGFELDLDVPLIELQAS